MPKNEKKNKKQRKRHNEPSLRGGRCRILSLDGGGSKGVFTLGVLKKLEESFAKPLHKTFDVVFGTSTGSIIGTLLASGKPVDAIKKIYLENVPKIMSARTQSGRTSLLADKAEQILGEMTYKSCKTRVGMGIVAIRTDMQRPMIFKSTELLGHDSDRKFVAGFGAPLYQAVIASCSAYPFFKRFNVNTTTEGDVETIDGGYVANDPTLFAIADAVHAFKVEPRDTTVVSVGTGKFPPAKAGFIRRTVERIARGVDRDLFELAENVLEANGNTMELLREFLIPEVRCFRLNASFSDQKLRTTFLESDVGRLSKMFNQGYNSVPRDKARSIHRALK